ncbi:hypothetical protein [Roseovarius sp. Pro17]|uniref:hypothetical protein n=1 Tax=Roseovarius sp. Pro17 TaxID=3108175 RepID=UPI002D79F2AA|nr:hypothetical protein [Roseovarius sp. Pro17]
MHRRLFTTIAATTALLLGAAGTAAYAEGDTLSAPEVERLLTGNTAEGKWDGNSYRSYFGADGITIYQPQTGERLTGKWRVDEGTGLYESFWDTVGWTAYAVMRTDEGFAWSLDGKTYPFAMLEGRNLRD